MAADQNPNVVMLKMALANYEIRLTAEPKDKHPEAHSYRWIRLTLSLNSIGFIIPADDEYHDVYSNNPQLILPLVLAEYQNEF